MSLRPRSALTSAVIVPLAVVGLLAPAPLDGARAAVPSTSSGAMVDAVPARATGAATARIAGARLADPDRTSTTPTGRGWHPNASVATIKAFTRTGQRIVDLEVTKAAAKPTFSVSYVANSGEYKRGWWWYYGLSSEKVKAKLKAKKARLIDIEPYRLGGKTRYAVVMVKNTGVAKKTWKWFSKSGLSTIRAWAGKHRMRIVDSERFSVGGATRYSAVLIKNNRTDEAKWWHYYGLSASGLSAKLDAKQARLISLERRPDGTLDAIMTRGGFQGAWWYALGRTATQVDAFLSQVGGRPFLVDSRVVGGSRRYDVLVIDTTAPETRRIRNLVQDDMSGSWGFYAKQVDGNVVAGLNADTVFEPASVMKIVHAVTALRDVQAGNLTLTSPVQWRRHPSYPARYASDVGYSPSKGKRDKDICAYDFETGDPNGSAVTDELGSIIIEYMLKYSDNRTTDALTDLYGFEGINATMGLAGMTKSRMNHRMGCGATWDRDTDWSNRMTLVDAGRIYEGVQLTTLLDQERRADLYRYLLGGAIDPTKALAAMIDEEAVRAGLSEDDRKDFIGRVITRFKGGGYTFCPEPDECKTFSHHISTDAGIAFFPIKTLGRITTRPYVYGRFLDITVPCRLSRVKNGNCAEYETVQGGRRTLDVEILRQPAREALATW
ncbi:serine hydrolase [Nocardioides sp.]|uniref:serine hydrolase n=1 Tax=Nocardioides sp. TaxID=35761 RepID=UPI002B270859|nr:serine hydrolase [Nocardioides sp.]